MGGGIAASGALLAQFNDRFENQDWVLIGYYWSLATAFAILAFFALRLHDGMTRYFSMHQALDVAEAVLFAELMTFLALFTLTRLDGVPRSIPIVHGLLLFAGLLAARIFIRFVATDDDATVHYGSRRERIIVIGANPLASGFIRLLEAFVPQRQTVIAVLDARSDMSGKAISGVRVLGAPHELEPIISEFVVHGIKTDRVVIAGEANVLSPAVLQEIERVCKKRQILLSFLPQMLGFTEEIQQPSVQDPAIQLTSYEAASSYFRLKRCMDVVASGALVVLLSPVLVLVALMVFFDVGRPVLFWQERLGWKGRSFLIYKFRTLRAPFEAADDSLNIRKPSVIGRLLRATRVGRAAATVQCVAGRDVFDRTAAAPSGGSAFKYFGQAFGSARNYRLGATSRWQAHNPRRKGKIGRVVCPECFVGFGPADLSDDAAAPDENSNVIEGSAGRWLAGANKTSRNAANR